MSNQTEAALWYRKYIRLLWINVSLLCMGGFFWSVIWGWNIISIPVMSIYYVYSVLLSNSPHCAATAVHWPVVCPLVPSGREHWWGRWHRSGSPGLTWRIIQHRDNQLEASSSTNLHTEFKLQANNYIIINLTLITITTNNWGGYRIFSSHSYIPTTLNNSYY